jgi:hypothetical protein
MLTITKTVTSKIYVLPLGFAVLASAVRLIVRVCPSASDQSRKPHKKQNPIALQNIRKFSSTSMEGGMVVATGV